MVKILFDTFLKARDEVIDAIYKYVDSKEGKEIKLPSNKNYTIVGDQLCTQIYTKLYIKNNFLIIEYEFGEGANPETMDTYADDFESLSMNEIYDVIISI